LWLCLAVALVALGQRDGVQCHGGIDDGDDFVVPWEEEDWRAHDMEPKGLDGLVMSFGFDEVVPHSHQDMSGAEGGGMKGGPIPHVLIVYHSSETRHTDQMAHVILNGALDLIPSCHIEAVPVHRANYSVLVDWADVLVLGSPVIYRQPAPEILEYIHNIPDTLRSSLSSLRGAAFVTAAGAGGGQEMVIDSLNRELTSLGIQPLSFPDCRYPMGLAAITDFPPYCRQDGNREGCAIEADEPAGKIHSHFEGFGYEFGRQLIVLMTDPNAVGSPY